MYVAHDIGTHTHGRDGAGGVCGGVAQLYFVCGMLDDRAAAALASSAPLLLRPWCSGQVWPQTFLL